jgi:hypothetical protein
MRTKIFFRVSFQIKTLLFTNLQFFSLNPYFVLFNVLLWKRATWNFNRILWYSSNFCMLSEEKKFFLHSFHYTNIEGTKTRKLQNTVYPFEFLCRFPQFSLCEWMYTSTTVQFLMSVCHAFRFYTFPSKKCSKANAHLWLTKSSIYCTCFFPTVVQFIITGRNKHM